MGRARRRHSLRNEPSSHMNCSACPGLLLFCAARPFNHGSRRRELVSTVWFGPSLVTAPSRVECSAAADSEQRARNHSQRDTKRKVVKYLTELRRCVQESVVVRLLTRTSAALAVAQHFRRQDSQSGDARAGKVVNATTSSLGNWKRHICCSETKRVRSTYGSCLRWEVIPLDCSCPATS